MGLKDLLESKSLSHGLANIEPGIDLLAIQANLAEAMKKNLAGIESPISKMPHIPSLGEVAIEAIEQLITDFNEELEEDEIGYVVVHTPAGPLIAHTIYYDRMFLIFKSHRVKENKANGTLAQLPRVYVANIDAAQFLLHAERASPDLPESERKIGFLAAKTRSSDDDNS